MQCKSTTLHNGLCISSILGLLQLGIILHFAQSACCEIQDLCCIYFVNVIRALGCALDLMNGKAELAAPRQSYSTLLSTDQMQANLIWAGIVIGLDLT